MSSKRAWRLWLEINDNESSQGLRVCKPESRLGNTQCPGEEGRAEGFAGKTCTLEKTASCMLSLWIGPRRVSVRGRQPGRRMPCGLEGLPGRPVRCGGLDAWLTPSGVIRGFPGGLMRVLPTRAATLQRHAVPLRGQSRPPSLPSRSLLPPGPPPALSLWGPT